MNTNLALLFIISSFYRVLFNVFFGKSIGKSASGIIGTLAVFTFFWLQLISSRAITSTAIQISLLIGFKSAISR
jgi:NADH-quinone oxidoreductase subunit L